MKKQRRTTTFLQNGGDLEDSTTEEMVKAARDGRKLPEKEETATTA
jgi:hypothetical protein